METPFIPFDPDGNSQNTQPRLRDIPIRAIFPNLLTLLAICSGLTSIRFSIEGRIELAVAAILLAAVLDGLDGRVARFLKSTTRFGAQMDSLADFVNFGVAPAMMLYFTLMDSVRSFGWIAALIFAICACLRLARFNVMIDMPSQPKWQNNYFVGVPAPAAALTVIAPVYILLLGVERSDGLAVFTTFYTLAIGLLMISSLPTFSGKEFGKRIARDLVLPLMIVLVTVVAFLLTYPWQTLLIFVFIYLAMLPFSWHSWRKQMNAQIQMAHEAAKPANPKGRKTRTSKTSKD
ncbi:MAG: CDP-diacylglycerol--serine O-phosphatidyltransferase [Pseudomonadota bacterium]